MLWMHLKSQEEVTSDCLDGNGGPLWYGRQSEQWLHNQPYTYPNLQWDQASGGISLYWAGEAFGNQATQDLTHSNRAETTSFFLEGKEDSSTKMRSDLGWDTTRKCKVHYPGQWSDGMGSMVRARAPYSHHKIVYPETRWACSRATWERLQGLDDILFRDGGRSGREHRRSSLGMLG